ncbi:DUF4192 family protein [Agromyces protaetiae]|nr:DUF4192 family protein [Agromyces protaetiae]
MTTIIRAEAAHDFLALLPSLAGYRPARSLVAVAFSGNRTAGVIRFDLPAKVDDRQRLAERVVAMLCRLPDVDALVPVVYSDARYRGAAAAGERELLRRVADRADDAGFHVRDVLRVARDAWGSLLDAGTPAAGRSLALIDESPAAAHPVLRGRGIASPEGAAELPEVRPEEVAEVARVLALVDEEPGGLLDRLGDAADPVTFVERLVGDARSERKDESLVWTLSEAEASAWFVHLAERPAIRDAMMLQIGFGEEVGAVAMDDAFDTIDRAEEAGLSVDDFVRRETRRGGGGLATTIVVSNLMLGLTSERPDVERVERGLEHVKRAIALAPEAQRPPALCIAAWLSWSLGRGSAAWAFLERSAAIDPEHSMTALLSAYFGSGALPEWAFTAPTDRRAA